jgi:hypothetical protein
MFDELLTNKYFCAALMIALALGVYMYMTKSSCGIEGMRNVDLSPLSHEIIETPWVERQSGPNKKYVNNDFDKYADDHSKKKLKKNKYSYTDWKKRSDERYVDYVNNIHNSGHKPKTKNTPGLYPKPIDDRPDLSQCQPCRCDTDRLMATEDSSEDD